MAANEKDDNLEEAKPSKKKKFLMLILLVLLLLGISAGGLFVYEKFFNDKNEGPTPEEIAAKKAKEELEQRLLQKEIYVPLGAPFTYTVKGERRTHNGQLELVLVVIGEENEALAKKHLVLLNSVVFDKLSAQTYESLLLPTGRNRLKRELLDAVRARMTEVAKAPVVEQVLFTSFVLQ